MSILLADALRELALKPGESRSVSIDGYEVEVRRPALAMHDEGPMVDIFLNVPPSPKALTFVVQRSEKEYPSPIEITETDLVPE